MSVRTMRYEIIGWQGEPKEAKARWREIADDCREVVNCIWQQWEVWHVSRGHERIAKQYADSLVAYRRNETTVKPKLELQWWGSEVQAHIYRQLVTRWPKLHTRVVVLLLNITKQRMAGKDVDGRWNIWLSVLLNRQGRPNCTHDVPVPFDSKNSKPVAPVEKSGNYSLVIQLERTPREGKCAVSINDSVQLKARGSGAAILKKINDGLYKFCGSSIVYQSSRNKWFALIAYNDNSQVELRNEGGTAVIRGAKRSPWKVRIGGRTMFFGGNGSYIASTRRSLLTSRWSRQECYRWAGSSNKGHGRKRAMQGVQKLSEGWKDFVKTCNHTTSRRLVDMCVERGIKTLVYCQPTEAKRDSKFLSYAGKVPGREDSTGWDWSQFAVMCSYKCKDAGIHFVIKKSASGPKKQGPKVTKKSNRSQKASGAVAAQ